MSALPHNEPPVHFRDVVEHLPLVPYVDRLDEISTAVYIGPQIEELTGYPWEAFRADQQLFLRLVHPDDRDHYLALVERRNRDNVPASGEYRLVRRDGRVVWVADHEQVVEDARGRPVAAQGYLIDITERRSQRVRLEAINTVLAAFSAGVSNDELVRTGLEVLADAVPGLRFSYLSVDDGGNLALLHSAGRSSLPPIEPRRISGGELTEFLAPLRRGETVSSSDGSRADLFGVPFDTFGPGDVAAFLDVPIRHAGRLVGIICGDAPTPRTFDADDVTTLKELGRQLAIVLERERAEGGLRRRDEVLSSVSRGAAVVMAGAAWEDTAPGLLESLGRAIEASRAYIFQLGTDTAGRTFASQRFEWVAEGVTPEIDNPELQHVVLAETGLADLERAIHGDEVRSLLVRDLPPPARALMEAQSIRSLLLVPIVVEGEAWGFVGFDDCEVERHWSRAETDALRAAASVLGAAIARERSEAAIRGQQSMIRAVFDSSFDGIFVLDDRRRVVDLNDAAAAFHDRSREEVLGRPLDELLTFEQREGAEARWQAFLAGGAVVGEARLERRDGTTLDVEYSARPHVLPGLSIAFLRDVTDRRRLEERLQAAQRLESMGRLAGGVAHDFNNLLTAITGYTGLAIDRAAHDPGLVQDLTEIQRAADRAADLTRQLLAFGRRQVLSPQPLDLETVVADVEPMLRRLVGDSVGVEIRHDPTTPPVFADPGQLEQVVVNLAMNARDAMPDGGALTITTYPTIRDGRQCAALEVADSGVGMSPETRARAFEPFFTTRPEGVGLGLASVYGVVAQSDGAIEVASEPGQGSRFTVMLPAGDASAAEPSAPEPDVPAEGSETVLLVEDEDVVRSLAVRVLEEQGYRVLACRGGSEAIELAGAHEGAIHALLTDVVMPGMRGHEVADRIAEARPGIRVVYMSGYADEPMLGRAADGRSFFLEKPFSSAELTRKLREALTAEPS